MNWSDFGAKVLAIADTRGCDFIAKATHPEPQADKLDAWYVIPISIGPAGYVTRHGQRYELE